MCKCIGTNKTKDNIWINNIEIKYKKGSKEDELFEILYKLFIGEPIDPHILSSYKEKKD